MSELKDSDLFSRFTASKSSILLTSILIATLLLFLFASQMPKKTSPPFSIPVPSKTSLPTVATKQITSLTLEPTQKTVNVGDTLPLEVAISGEPVQAVDIVLHYDPQFLRADAVIEGTVFSRFLQKTINKGTIIISTSIDPAKSQIAATSGTVFTVNFSAIAPASSTDVTFNTQKTILAKGGVNYLGTATGGTYVVK